MATLKAVVDHRKADGTYCVKIRLTHNRKSLYIPTQIYITDLGLTRSKKIKDTNVLMTLNRIIDKMRAIMLDIEGVEYLPCDALKNIIIDKMKEGKVFRLDFIEYANRKIKELNNRNKKLHIIAIQHLQSIFGNIDVNELTTALIVKYRDQLIEDGLAVNSVAQYMTKIRHLLNLAKDEYNDDYSVKIRVNPFRRNVMPKIEKTKHRVLTAQQIRRISEIKGDRYENFARDVFMLSFYLIGANMIDLFTMKTSAFDGDVITYRRSKTEGERADNAEISIRVEKECQELLMKYKGDKTYLFNFFRRYVDTHTFNVSVNRFLNRFKKYDKTLPSNLTTYYARHSWATIAYNDCDIDMQTIHEALNHASDANMKITDVYVKKDFTRIWEANRKVLDYVFGSDNK